MQSPAHHIFYRPPAPCLPLPFKRYPLSSVMKVVLPGRGLRVPKGDSAETFCSFFGTSQLQSRCERNACSTYKRKPMRINMTFTISHFAFDFRSRRCAIPVSCSNRHNVITSGETNLLSYRSEHKSNVVITTSTSVDNRNCLVSEVAYIYLESCET